MATGYVPDRGDIVWLNFSPHAGHEQAGHRPAVVLSPAVYNGRTGMMICCPMTTLIKGNSFEVAVAGDRRSVALADHVKSVDWRARQASFAGHVTPAELAKIRARIRPLIW
jgi:mRNA interferase MazF